MQSKKSTLFYCLVSILPENIYLYQATVETYEKDVKYVQS